MKKLHVDSSNIKTFNMKGFTLVEMLVTMLVAMVVLGGLLLNFSTQNYEYKYQGKRIDAVQDLEFVMKFIAEDMRGALRSATINVAINPNPPTALPTTSVDFYAWDEAEAAAPSKRAHRKYVYDAANQLLKYDREIDSALAIGGADNPKEILRNVTYFKIFNDSIDTAADRTLYNGIPSPQLPINVPAPPLNGLAGYTILIEVGVDAGYKNGSFIDVLGNDHSRAAGGDGHKRIWRYMQVRPRTSVN